VKVNGFQAPASLHKTESSLVNLPNFIPNNKQGVYHTGGCLPFYIKNYLKAKEELWETQIFHPAKI